MSAIGFTFLVGDSRTRSVYGPGTPICLLPLAPASCLLAPAFHPLLIRFSFASARRRVDHESPREYPGPLAPFPHEGLVMRSQLLAAVAVLAASVGTARADHGLTKGTPDLKSASALAFGPHGILFVGDPAVAAIF